LRPVNWIAQSAQWDNDGAERPLRRHELPVGGWKRQFVAFGCSRSAGVLCRAMVATRERPLSLSLTFSAA
jgi:hypothetical protein